MSLLDTIGNTLNNLAGGSAGQAALKLGEQYLAGKLSQDEYDAQIERLNSQKTMQPAATLPAWAIPAALGTVAVLVVVLIAGRRS
jgi:hypothetical protein